MANPFLFDDEKDESSKGYNIDLFTNKTNALHYECVICKEICRNPVELSCVEDPADCDYDEDTAYNHDALYCEACLAFSLASNNSQCPINPKHLKTSYNIARNIRKQINNLSVYCRNYNNKRAEFEFEGNDETGSGCDWHGKLFQLSTHLKSCKYNKKITCDICNVLCIENNIKKHHNQNIVQHIKLLRRQSIKNVKNNEQINELQADNDKLKQDVKTLKLQYNEWKIAHSIESAKKEIKLKKQLKKQSDVIQLLQKQYGEHTLSIATLQTQFDKFRKNTIKNKEKEKEKVMSVMPPFKSTKSLPPTKARLTITGIPPLKRTNSTRYFHPKGTERYHPKGLKYEMYHPKKCQEVWVSKAIGNMSKVYRYPCCGSAKEGSIYLAIANVEKCDDAAIYVVGSDKKLPKKWNDEMHLGCTRNKKRNQKNMSYYDCCEKGILSAGCKKRYKCCKEDYVADSGGCKVGWGC